MINILNNMNMKKKIILIFIISAFIPQIIMDTIYYITLRNNLLENEIKDAKKNVFDVRNAVTQMINTSIDVSNKLYLDKDLLNIMSTNYSNFIKYYDDIMNYNEITNLLIIYKNALKNIRIYSFNKTNLSSGQILPVDNFITNQQWFKEAIKNDGKISFQLVYDNDPIRPTYYLSLVRLIKNSYGERLGVMNIYLNIDELRQILSQNDQTLIAFNNGTIVGSKDNLLINKKMNIISKNKNGTYNITIGNINLLAIIDSIEITYDPNDNIKVISSFPIKVINQKVSRAMTKNTVIIILNIIISLILFLIFSNMITSRVNILNKKVNQIAKGNLDIELSLMGNDEIGELSNNISNMAKSLKKLIEEVYIANMQKHELLSKQKDIQLQVLSNQMNPHFLFNTLEVIRMMAICSENNDVSNAIYLLSNLLRKSLNMPHTLITIDKELEILQEYLKIQKIRFANRIQYILNYSQDILQYKIPPFTLQPIVENSIVHGIENKLGISTIVISLIDKNDGLYITVEDNGIGIDEEKLKHIKELIDIDYSKEENPKFIGIRNIFQRLKLYYGDDFEFNIESQKDIGTKVSLFLPKR
ncbi:sensor histidine kinase [Caldicellulosiruptoraceae bacterium PP1]